MRKLSLSLFGMLFATGLVIAAPVVLLSFDGKQMKVKEGENEHTYKITEKTSYVLFSADGVKDIAPDIAVKVLMNEKSKGKKIELVVDGDKVTQVKIPSKKKT